MGGNAARANGHKACKHSVEVLSTSPDMPGTRVREPSPAVTMLQPLIEFLCTHPPYSSVPPTQIAFLAKRLQSRYYARGQPVAADGGLCIVRRGRIALSASDATTLEAGATLLGPCQGIAATDTLCLELDADGFDALGRQAPDLARALADTGLPRSRPQQPD